MLKNLNIQYFMFICDYSKAVSLTFSAQLCLVFVSKNSKAPPPAWARALSMCRLAVGLKWRKRTPLKKPSGLKLLDMKTVVRPVQTWGRRWRGGCAERCLWPASRWALRSGCGRPTAAAGSWRRGTEGAGWELAGGATAQCCPPLESGADSGERRDTQESWR